MGVYPKSEGYPNTIFRLEYFTHCKALDFHEIHTPIALNNFHSSISLIKKLVALFRLAGAYISIFLRYLLYIKRCRQADIAYLPYPGIATALMLWSLPEKMRPRKIYLDAFISLYDTAVNDRSLLPVKSMLSKLLWKIERMGYSAVDKVIVDTPQNSKFMAELFKLPLEKFISIPLATSEFSSQANISPKKPPDHPVCNVLFIGTMIPLHGISTILEAIKQLESRDDIRFKLIGNGQQGKLISDTKKWPKNLEWAREWQCTELIAKAIAEADICLGIFGQGMKAQRVCPYKIYAYANIGKCIITAETEWSSSVREICGYSPFALIPPGDANALANKIVQLAENSTARETFASASKHYYNDYLSKRNSEKLLMDLLFNQEALVIPASSGQMSRADH